MGLPSGSMTRPSMLSLTSIEAIRFVRRTSSPSFTASTSPKSTAPTLSSSRLSTRPVTPLLGNSISSLACTLDRP